MVKRLKSLTWAGFLKQLKILNIAFFGMIFVLYVFLFLRYLDQMPIKNLLQYFFTDSEFLGYLGFFYVVFHFLGIVSWMVSEVFFDGKAGTKTDVKKEE